MLKGRVQENQHLRHLRQTDRTSALLSNGINGITNAMVLVHQGEKDYYIYYYLFVDVLFQNHAPSILGQFTLSEKSRLNNLQKDY